jgi:hypothetical protein
VKVSVGKSLAELIDVPLTCEMRPSGSCLPGC